MTAATCSAPGCALAHRLQPVADGLQGDVGIRALDGGADGGQAVVRLAPSGTAEHRLAQEAVADMCQATPRFTS